MRTTAPCAAVYAAIFLWSDSARAQDAMRQNAPDCGKSLQTAVYTPDYEKRSVPTESEYVPTHPPTHEIHGAPYIPMAEMMAMDDTAPSSEVLVDQFEWRDAQSANALTWDAKVRYGTDYNKVLLRTEGDRLADTAAHSDAEGMWDHVFSRWWSVQTGVRHDFGKGPSRDWMAAGVEGLAPYFFEIEATTYVGDAGRTAARLKAEYELRFSQRAIVQPWIELNAYGRDDRENRIGSGVSDLELALRLRYEVRHEIAPYVGIAWVRRFGKTADLVRAAGENASDLQSLIGIRLRF